MTVPLVVAGCGGDEVTPPGTTIATSPSAPAPPPATDPPATAAPGTSTTTGAPGDEAEVRAVIDRYWPAFLEATMNPDPEHPVLRELLRGEAMTRILGAIAAMERDGQRVVQPEGTVLTHEILTVSISDSNRAIVTECVVDSLQIVEAATGVVINDTATTSEYTTTLAKDDSGWHIVVREQSRRIEGIHPCGVLG